MLLNVLIDERNNLRYKYTEEDIEFLRKYYPVGDWDKINNRFLNLTKSSIYRKVNKLNIKSKNSHRKNFNNSKVRKKWTSKEIDIMLENYEHIPLEKIMSMLPNRTKDSIGSFASRHNLKSFNFKKDFWSDEDMQYIIENWELEPDKLMAENIGRTFRSVKWKREELDLYRRDMDRTSYPTLSKYLRGQNQKWKNESMENCNFKCVLTKSKDFEIHHLYSVSNILNDILTKYKILKDKSFSEYSEDELSFILDNFILEQGKYPLGECVDKKFHVLFHSMYGQYYNTPEQWYRFKKDFNEGKYNKYI